MNQTKKELSNRFVSLKKEHDNLMNMEKVSLVYLGAFFDRGLARTTDQSEFLLNLALTDINVMRAVIKSVEEYYKINNQKINVEN